MVLDGEDASSLDGFGGQNVGGIIETMKRFVQGVVRECRVEAENNTIGYLYFHEITFYRNRNVEVIAWEPRVI